jgi:DNA-binding transcriptional LysR family regulator
MSSDIDPRLFSVFAAVVRSGGVSRAAARLGLHKSAVSRSLSRLESELGVRLVRRTTHRIALTEVGEQVLRHAEEVEAALARIDEVVAQEESEVRGRLRVSSSAALGHLHVLPVIVALGQRHPALEISLELEERFVDLVAEGFDVALRFAEPRDSSLTGVKLADNPRILVASPSYLAKHGAPGELADLRGHACLLYANGARIYDEWPFVGPGGPVRVRVSGKVCVNHGRSLLDAAVLGAGILLVDRMLIGDELATGALVELLPRFRPALGFPLHALYPGGLVPNKTKVFVAAMKDRLAAGRARRRP